MSYLLPHLTNGYAVDQAIMTVRVWLVSIGDNGRLFFFFSFDVDPDLLFSLLLLSLLHLLLTRSIHPNQPEPNPNHHQEEDRVVAIRFGSDADPTCMVMDEALSKIADAVKAFAVIYLVDLTQVPDFNDMYELYNHPLHLLFFYRNRHIQVDLGTGDNNKVTWPMSGQELIDILEVVYRGASKGRGLVVSPKDYSTKYRY